MHDPELCGQYRISDFGLPIDRELKAGRTVRIDDALAHPLTAEDPVAAEFSGRESAPPSLRRWSEMVGWPHLSMFIRPSRAIGVTMR